MCKHLYIAERNVGIGVHAVCAWAEYQESCRAVIQAHIVGHLVVSPLEEWSKCAEYSCTAVSCDTACHSDCSFLCDADVDELSAVNVFLTDTLHKAKSHGSCGIQNNGIFVGVKQLFQAVKYNIFAALIRVQRRAVLNVEGAACVPAFTVLFGVGQTFSLDSMDMEHNRVVDALHALKQLHQLCGIVTLIKIAVVQSHCTENIILGSAIRFTELFQRFVESAVIFSDTLVVVIDDDDEVLVVLSCVVKSFQSLAARK